MGGAAAVRAKQLGLRVIGVRNSGRPHPAVDDMFKPDGLDEALRDADFVLVSVPLTSATLGLIDKNRLGLMKPSASLINMARAEVVDYRALADKLVQGELSGAILDVFDPEPLPPDSFLWDIPNLILTPHVSSDDPERYIPDVLDLLFAKHRVLFVQQTIVESNRSRARVLNQPKFTASHRGCGRCRLCLPFIHPSSAQLIFFASGRQHPIMVSCFYARFAPHSKPAVG